MEKNGAMVAFSAGKDSTAMLLRMLELGPEEYPITRILFADTNFEFPELYEYIKKVQEYIDTHYPERGLKIESVHSKRTWEEWFYGEITRGKNEGKVRGAPLIVFPCYWAREAKLYPLQRASKECSVQYVGIAADEPKRISKHAERDGIRYPLVEWGWSEEDAFRYLDSLNMVNPLYTNFTRLGCYHCIKQPLSSWYVLWKRYPELWENAKYWDNESHRVSGHGMAHYETLQQIQERFEQGFVPEGRRPFECNSCDAVGVFHDDQQGIIDTWGGEDDLHSDNAMSCEIADPGNPAILAQFKWVKKEEAAPQAWW